MKRNYLLPNKFATIGWLLFLPGLVLGLIFLIFEPDPQFLNIHLPALVKQSFLGSPEYLTITENNISDEIIAVLLVLGLLIIAFSKEKHEDEFMEQMRLRSLVFATYVNFIVLLFAILFVYDMMFFWVLVFNMFTVLLVFVIRFKWAIYKSRKQLHHEE